MINQKRFYQTYFKNSLIYMQARYKLYERVYVSSSKCSSLLTLLLMHTQTVVKQNGSNQNKQHYFNALSDFFLLFLVFYE